MPFSRVERNAAILQCIVMQRNVVIHGQEIRDSSLPVFFRLVNLGCNNNHVLVNRMLFQCSFLTN